LTAIAFYIGPVEITGFGLMVGVGALAGLWVLQQEAEARGLPPNATNAGVAGVVGGLIGAKVLYVAEHLGREPAVAGLLSRGGMSWFGGVAGGALLALAIVRALRLPLWPLLAAGMPALALGQAFGRVGCFLVGDDYGRPTDLPWGVAFPEGLPPTTVRVHPTQLYEALFLAALAALLWHGGRRLAADRKVVAAYCVLGGAFRFALEFIRINERVALGMSLAQWGSLALVAVGAVLAVVEGRR